MDTLRVVFVGLTGKVPAVYCTDYYAEEIAAEESGQSDSTFYSRTYRDPGPYTDWKSRWICPNLTKTEIDIENPWRYFTAAVVTCAQGKDSDPTFEPDVTCIDPSETNMTMTRG